MVADLPEYEIYAIKYAERTGTRGGIFMHADPHDAPLDMDYYVWLVRSAERSIVIDIGFGREEGERRGRTFLRCPAESLGLLGVDPVEVEDVIITHLHYDHAGNLERFPNARFHVQDRELEYVTGRAMTHVALRHAFRLEDVQEMVALVYGERVFFHDGDEELCAGISLHHMPGHTRGLQSVRVHSQRGWVLLASDAAHYYESIEQEATFTTHENLFEMHESYRRLRRLGGAMTHIVPGHDPLVLERYPAPAPELSGIVARLDLPPAY